jgi:hypothetical protein
MRYAKKNIYADVEEEGGTINRLVAVEGQPIPAAYAHLVDDKDTTDSPPSPVDRNLSRGTSTRRAVTPTVADSELAREEREAAEAKPRRRSSAKADAEVK